MTDQNLLDTSFFCGFDVEEDSKKKNRPPRCNVCRRVPVNGDCLCKYLPQPHPIELKHANALNVFILQHTAESNEFKNTANLIPACLGNAHLYIGKTFTRKMFGPLFEDACNDTQGTWILFPSPDAVDICDIVANNLKETNNPLQGPYPMRNLIVIDGTWHTAKRILSKNANILSQMRPVCIKPTKAGNYRIRGEPNSQCLSTIEATACCISTIEGDESVYDKMMMPLNGLVESHQERMALVNKN